MKRASRNEIASAASALCPASFGVYLWLFFSYFSSHPTKPNADAGFVYQLNNHGSYVYLSSTEATGLALLWVAFFAGFSSVLIAGGVVQTDLTNPTPKLKAIFLFSLVFCVAVIWLAGRSIADFFVSHGIIFHF
jgi:hypothetical protein